MSRSKHREGMPAGHIFFKGILLYFLKLENEHEFSVTSLEELIVREAPGDFRAKLRLIL